jgi:hypothetical protein
MPEHDTFITNPDNAPEVAALKPSILRMKKSAKYPETGLWDDQSKRLKDRLEIFGILFAIMASFISIVISIFSLNISKEANIVAQQQFEFEKRKYEENIKIEISMNGNLNVYMLGNSERYYQNKFDYIFGYDYYLNLGRSIDICQPLEIRIFNLSGKPVTVQKATLFLKESKSPEWYNDHFFEPWPDFWGKVTVGERQNMTIEPDGVYLFEVEADVIPLHGDAQNSIQEYVSNEFDPYFNPQTEAHRSYSDGRFLDDKTPYGNHNWLIDALFTEALQYYFAKCNTYVYWEYSIETANGNTYAAVYEMKQNGFYRNIQ